MDMERERLQLAQEINAEAASGGEVDPAVARRLLEEKHGQVWNTDELAQDYEVLGFGAPLVVVRRKVDGKRGSLVFQHCPRFYFGFEEA